MSNCIDIHNSRLELSKEIFNIPGFKEWFNKQEVKDKGGYTHFYWFLSNNTTIKEDKVIIEIGRGFSSHTWRDFRWLVWVLNPFFIKPIRHIFKIADECDGFDLVESIEVNWPYASPEEIF